MDKRLVGKWHKEEMGETLNIFDEEPLRMKLSFASSGHYHAEPNCVYEKDGCYCFEINDDDHRMVYHLQFSDGQMVGFYTLHGHRTPVTYEKVSDVPEDQPYQYLPTESYVPYTGKTRRDILREYAGYDRSIHDEYHSTFVLGGDIPDILEKYRYSAYMEGMDASGDEIVFRLLDFVCDHFGHDGSHGLGSGRTITDLIQFCEKNNGKSNCRGLAILLASLIRLNGIKARHITCMPFEEPFDDCHVVVDCLLPSGQQIMLDPSNRLYYTDRDGRYVSLPHFREMLLTDEPLFENETASYNGAAFNPEENRYYMIKNTFRFACCTLNQDGIDGNTQTSRYIELIPKGYPTDHFPEARKKNFVYNDREFWEI